MFGAPIDTELVTVDWSDFCSMIVRQASFPRALVVIIIRIVAIIKLKRHIIMIITIIIIRATGVPPCAFGRWLPDARPGGFLMGGGRFKIVQRGYSSIGKK